MNLKIGISIKSRMTPLPVALDADATAFINRLTTPSDALKVLINKTIIDLKGINKWADQDVIVFLCMDVQANNLNWKGNTCTPTYANAPTFTAKTGIVTNGTTQYIDTNFNPSTNGVNFTRNNASICLGKYIVGNNGTYRINGHFTENMIREDANPDTINGTNGQAAESTPGKDTTGSFTGFKGVSRHSSTKYYCFKNAVRSLELTENSVALPNKNIWFGRANGTASYLVNGGYNFYSMGAKFASQAEWDSYIAIMQYFISNVGAT